ncbi:hypothetical protein SteCoe_14019 [Stentor coeruleus]|uniref:Uncharacterized protein n=1 Tax=Stentor coeruleus TaxID=5963 RepID=A0A1R2C6Y1_9CILI|nr:hypothetical protein SteCoe_14019 [Stentor coeruleus]
MKQAIGLFTLLIVLTQSRMYVPKKSLYIGETCGSNYYFQVSNFTANPWPPVLGQSMLVEMSGIFDQLANVSVIGIGQSLSGQSWNYTTVKVNQIFSAGQSQTFSTVISAGNNPGYCYLQYALKNQDDMFLACWHLQYQLF